MASRAAISREGHARAFGACVRERAGGPCRERRHVMIDSELGYTPTPALSHAVLAYNRDRTTGLSDGIVITPSHNPPEDGGFKYNPPNGGPADTNATKAIENRANDLMAAGFATIPRMPLARALSARNHASLRLCFGLRR